ncbi:hypothetical protein CHLNCDRAFT_36103 [Chlorella variabilis]|uniref:Cationic amino acid transporter C-terminal domain-containing protein n=1 Tax=Chlorella variabilis TaxID=554065 RepID=E1ZIV5_CHLVA|nr:hypothetical protein CHLNCDRAFT_36103 [Chlorella variabilis]EFN54400.1 hypothetical protein CHLNCDRAFT_36103 [Chlorella variabilis]|eukprot:XP_005846502.1 hypothetical protein CHLNCDRAFT_36103 [Chlorella variabilis]
MARWGGTAVVESWGGTLAFLKEYWAALRNTHQIFWRIAFRRRTLEEELQEALLRGSLRKAFSGFDLLLLGLGIVIGSGWAQLSGVTAQQFAGPSIILSYLFSGVAMLLAAACFAELVTEYPVSGGAFAFVMINFGELAAFVTLGGLVLEYALGMAAVARGFSRYLARLCNLDQNLFVLEFYDCPPGLEPPDCPYTHSFDFMAAGVVVFVSFLLSIGVRESAFFITAVTAIKVVLLVFISIVGYTRAGPTCEDTSQCVGMSCADYCQLQGVSSATDPFFDPDFGANGVFLGAAALFFTYTGMDAICNAAEEARDVAHLPWALVGTVGVSMLLYTMLAVAMMYIATPNAAKPALPPIGQPSETALTFTTAFYIVSLAALSGIVTALTVGLFSLSRIVMAASRDWLLPPFLARISPRTQTPLVAQMVLGVIIGGTGEQLTLHLGLSF